MKAGIVGIGAVGSASAMAIASRSCVRELVLVNRNRACAKGVATDMRYGVYAVAAAHARTQRRRRGAMAADVG